MIHKLPKVRFQTSYGWKTKYPTKNNEASIKKLVISCGWHKHFLKNKGFVYILNGSGTLTINQGSEKTVSQGDLFVLDEHTLIYFDHAQLKYLYGKNVNDLEFLNLKNKEIFSNNGENTEFYYVLEGSGTVIDSNNKKVIINSGDMVELEKDDNVEIKGKLKLLKFVSSN